MSETSERLPPLRRRMTARDPAERHRASTPLELLFDLTFVVAVAQAGTQLHQALVAGWVAHALASYAVVFFAIWWAWMNFTWFASAYDTDDALYRLLTVVQMAGVLVLAAGIPAMFDHFDFTVGLIGYVVMRLAMVGQWLRAAREHPESRACTLRYAGGVAFVQVCWIAWVWLRDPAGVVGFVVLVLAELAVPVWAEFAGKPTSWHPGHINERYGLFTIIVLGEVLAAGMLSVERAVAAGAVSDALVIAAAAGLVLVFGLWWSYFKHPMERRIRRSLPQAVVWGYSHYLVFAAVAALGAGMQVVIGAFRPASQVTPMFAAFTVAVPVAVFLVVLALLTARMSDAPVATPLVVITAVLVLLAASAARVLTLAGSMVAIAALVVVLLAYHLAVPQRRREPDAEVVRAPEGGD